VIDVLLLRKPKTDPGACDPFTMSRLRASVSAIAREVMIKIMKDFMMCPKFDSFFLIKTDAYQRPDALEQKANIWVMP